MHALRPSRHGILVEVSDTAGPEAPTRWVLFDGRRSTAVPAYWRDATGSGRRWRWDLDTHRTEPAEVPQDVGEAMTAPVGQPWDPARGPEVWVEDGHPVRDPSVASDVS